MASLVRVRFGQLHQLAQQQRILEDALDRLDEVRLERAGQLLARVARTQKLLQLARLLCTTTTTAAFAILINNAVILCYGHVTCFMKQFQRRVNKTYQLIDSNFIQGMLYLDSRASEFYCV